MRIMVEEGGSPDQIIRKHNLARQEAGPDVERTVKDILARNQGAVRDYRSGEQKALHFLVGQVMRETRGQIDANDARKLLVRHLKK